ncbi:MAG: alpha/beta hydrolase-fold protein [Lacipirellulaceae bacterium]
MLAPLPDGWKIDDARPGPCAVTASNPGVRGTVVFLHDVEGALPDGLAEGLREANLVGVAPLTSASWWTDRRLPSDAAGLTAAARVVAEIQRAEARGPVALLGIGMGGHGALRSAYLNARRVAAVAALRPAIDCHKLIESPLANDRRYEALRRAYDEPERARQDSAILHIHPLNWPRKQWFGCPPSDPWWEGCDRLRMKLFSLGVPHECDLESPAIDLAVAVEWLAVALPAAVSPSKAAGAGDGPFAAR